jgi:hypothetical protein
MWRVVLVALLVVAAAALGRATAPKNDRQAGIQEGRALQQPAQARDAFKAGYAAGANDVFGGYDGGWDYDRSYVITLQQGSNGITYRIATRTPAS